MAQGNSDVWILDGARSIRLTFDPGIDGGAVWSPDGSRVAFNSLRTGVFNIFQKLASGAGPEERLLPSENLNIVTSWSRDGLLLYFTGDPKLGADLWVVPVAEGRAASPRVFLKTPTAEVFGAFSPDGRWVAYQLDRVGQSGLSEVYVRPIHAADPGGARTTKLEGQWQVSNGGGIRPRWRADGEELYFLDPAGMMMAVPMAVEGSALVPGTPVALFQSRIADGGVERQQATNYDVAPDGRFLIVRDLGDVTTPITLILNWRPPIP
jgi:Tol biopolymer transport system component